MPAEVPGLADLDSSGRKTLAAMSGTFTGAVVLPSDTRYHEARRVWNATVDRFPSLIAYCQSPGDVATAVRAARETSVPLSVRGGGHQVAGLCVSEGGLVVDLSGMRSVTIGDDGSTARAEGGCLLRDLDTATAAIGRAVPAGVVSHTGLGGLALGGGVGWTFRNFGLTCDNIVGAEVTTADGNTMYASERDDAELLWALRGGGGNFGVVTAFDLRLHALADVLFGQAVYPLGNLPAAVAHYVSVMAAAPDELTAICIVCGAPPMPAVPPDLIGAPIVMVNAVWSGDLQAGAGPMRKLVTGGGPLGSDIARMPYLSLQAMQDDLHPHGRNNYNKSRYLRQVDGTAIKALLEAARRLPGTHSQIELLHLGGAAARVASDATAFAHRDAAFILNVVAAWTDAAQAAAHVNWARDTYSAMDSVGSEAGYINFIEAEPDRVRSIYPPATYERLQRTKLRLDPDDIFQGNVPIKPAGEK